MVLVIIYFSLDYLPKSDEKPLVVATIDTVPAIKEATKIAPEIQPIEKPIEVKPSPKPATPKVSAPKPVVSKKETVAPPPKDPQRIIKKGWPATDEIQNIVNYAYKKGGKDFLLTLEWENGLWKWDRRSGVVGANGYYDYGICQLNGQWHGKFIFANGYNLKAGFSKDFQSPYKQIDYCIGVWNDAIRKGRIKSTFYAYNKRLPLVARFTWLQ